MCVCVIFIKIKYINYLINLNNIFFIFYIFKIVTGGCFILGSKTIFCSEQDPLNLVAIILTSIILLM